LRELKRIGREQPLAMMDEQAAFGRISGRTSAQVAGVRSSLAYFLRRYPLGAAGAAIVLAIVLMAVFADWITAFDPTATNSRASLAEPGGEHLLGADFMGRDMWSRIVFGARISLAVGIGATTLGCGI
jgi:peptide/nickel transport system permease protein